jgi:hypothetical protein
MHGKIPFNNARKEELDDLNEGSSRLFILITVSSLAYTFRLTGFVDWIATGIAFLD